MRFTLIFASAVGLSSAKVLQHIAKRHADSNGANNEHPMADAHDALASRHGSRRSLSSYYYYYYYYSNDDDEPSNSCPTTCCKWHPTVSL